MDLEISFYDPLAASFKKPKRKKAPSRRALADANATPTDASAVDTTATPLPDENRAPNVDSVPPVSTPIAAPAPVLHSPNENDTAALTPNDNQTALASSTAATSTAPVSTPAITSAGNDDGWEDQDSDDEDEEDEEDDEDDEEGVSRGEVGASSWAKRNPDKPMIPLRTGRKKQSTETRATAKLKRAANKKKSLDFQADIDNINEARNKLAVEVAEKHGVKVDVVLRRLMAKSSFKASRKVNLFNAKVHHLCKKARRMGNALGWADAKRKALTDPEFQNLSKVEEWALRAGLAADREKREKAARATNNAARADGQFTLAMVAEEGTKHVFQVGSFAQRTGIMGFGLFSRGHIHDKTIPTQIESMGALDFCQEVIGIPAQDLALKFELWCVARDKGLTGVDTLGSMRKEVNRAIGEGLVTTTGKKKIRMNYVQYWKRIVLHHGVILKGWPLDGGVTSPSDVNDVESMKTLRDALQSGECYWHKMTSNEKERAKEQYEDMVETGEIEVITRKVRSDKKTTRKPSKKSKSKADGPIGTRSKATGAKKRRVWEEEEDTEDEGEEDDDRAKKQKKKKSTEGRSGKQSKEKEKSGRGRKRKVREEDEEDEDEEDEEEDRSKKQKKKSMEGGSGKQSKEKSGQGKKRKVREEDEEDEEEEEEEERPRKKTKKTASGDSGGSYHSKSIADKRAQLLALAAMAKKPSGLGGKAKPKPKPMAKVKSRGSGQSSGKSGSKAKVLSKVPPGIRVAVEKDVMDEEEDDDEDMRADIGHHVGRAGRGGAARDGALGHPGSPIYPRFIGDFFVDFGARITEAHVGRRSGAAAPGAVMSAVMSALMGLMSAGRTPPHRGNRSENNEKKAPQTQNEQAPSPQTQDRYGRNATTVTKGNRFDIVA
ncbi:hypothetical protein C8F04DRAFT_1175398 [Mycena alexandri]|uniref:Uncharacterized protein n=1 Tax=Mycena alexandri TaxID=1745969 RepID=A0AAD6TC02_9AGAR|nr:hypothetical protein C8F04DRAFT_1175398 [Mycena alexandri]